MVLIVVEEKLPFLFPLENFYSQKLIIRRKCNVGPGMSKFKLKNDTNIDF